MSTATLARISRLLHAGFLLAITASPLARAGAPAADLQARHRSLQEHLSHNAFQRPLHLESAETAKGLQGDIYAVVDHPFSTVRPALQELDHWADILILHLNVKDCRALDSPAGRTLLVSLGRKNAEPLGEAYPVNFEYGVAAAEDDYLRVLLSAATGPLGSRNYRIALEAVPLPAGRTFIHLAYSYNHGVAVRLAMNGYLATLGSGKVGFSVTGRQADGTVQLIDGVRGIVERNTMRYYLAVEAYLDSLAVPPADRLEKRLHDWFAATERYSQQLHELDEGDYLAMKRKEVRRQQSGPGPDPSG